RWLERRARQAGFLKQSLTEEFATGEYVIDIGEEFDAIVAKAANCKDRGNAFAARSGHCLANHRVTVGGNQLVGAKLCSQFVAEPQILRFFLRVDQSFVIRA